MDIDNDQFVNLIRSALHYLYDPDQLRRSPLTGLFCLANRVDASFALQKILIDAIEAMRPSEQEPLQSRGWLLHDVLFFRYVRGYERHAVAAQLGISDRQLSRDQRAALEVLAQHLWKTCRPADASVQPAPAQPAPDAETESGQADWLEDLPAEKPCAWKPALLSVLELLQPLASQHSVTLALDPLDDLPDLLVPQQTFRHALLNLLGWLIPLAHHQALRLEPDVQGQLISITATFPTQDGDFSSDDNLLGRPAPSVARDLVERAGGAITWAASPGAASIRFSLPALAQVPVLVIDDNPDTLLLFQRYVQGTRYNLVGVGDPAEFYRQFETLHPRIIILDVMMPELDGWDLLSQLNQVRSPHASAILVCSILPQKDLAHSLGADGFLQKPVLPQDFLRSLDELMSRLTSESEA